MSKKATQVDTVINKAAPFAKPILIRLRTIVHKSCPEVEESIKWGCPHFMYRGKILCAMVNFKAHCRLGFWTGARLIKNGGKKTSDFFDKIDHLESIDDLPPEKEIAYHIHEAMKLLDEGPAPHAPRKKKPPIRPPSYFTRALKVNKKASKNFKDFSPSHQREYVEWVSGAKTVETRDRRLKTAVEWISKGKSRNWKYER